jgi:YVTN family beta-propeller protein
VSSGGDDRVIAFDLGTLKVTGEIAVDGKNPDAMLFDDASGRVFVFNGGSDNVSVIDPATEKVVATMPAPGKPELAVSDGRGKIFFNLEDKNEIAQADARTAKVQATWPLGTCEEPTGLAIDVVHRRLFSVCANRQMIVLSADDGHRVASVPIGARPDGAAFDPESATAFSPNSDGTLTVVHEDDPDHYRVVANVATPPRSRTIAWDAGMHRAVLAIAEFGAAPAATPKEPHPRPSMKPDSFGLLIVGRR